MRTVGTTALPSLALEHFRAHYGAGEMHALRAPARINILGEHVDYVSYLPTASLALGSREHAMWLLWRATDDGQIRGASTDERFAPFSFSLDEPAPDAAQQSWEDYLFNRPLPAPHWSNYVRGATAYARWQRGAQIKRGFDFLIDSTIPPHSGASSSSALVVLSGAAIRLANQIPFKLAELARDAAQAEWFTGTRGGALDHTTICLAQAGHALHIKHTAPSAALVPLPAGDFRWLTFFSHPADKGRAVMLAYNERAAIARIIPAVIKSWNKSHPRRALDWSGAVYHLRREEPRTADQVRLLMQHLSETMNWDELHAQHPQAMQEISAAFPTLSQAWRGRPLKLRDRALHHLGEVDRVQEAASLLRAIRREEHSAEVMRWLGKLINQSHASLRDLYEVSTPQVEQLIAIIRADAQVYGARLMGGGFGGNVLALTTAANVQPLIARVQKEFYQPQGRAGLAEGAVMVSTPGAGLAW